MHSCLHRVLLSDGKMASVTNYSSYNQAGAQQSYGSYTAPPSQSYGQTAQQGYSQQDYGSYTQPAAAPESTYSQAAPSAGAYAQQPYGSSYGQAAATTAAAAAAAPAAYGTAQPGTYNQPAQSYGASSYTSSTAAPAAQASYGSQPGYSAQPAYSGYNQQAAASAPQSYSASSQPAYNQGAYSQPGGYSQPQGGYQAQQPGYGQQQSSYGQPPQQGPPAAYPPQGNSAYTQAQYGQQGASQNDYSQQSAYNSYSQGGVSGGYPGSQQRGGYPGDAGRDGYGPRGRGGMGRGGMGIAGDRGGFNKPGGAMRGGMDRDMGHPGEQDSENSTIYITGLTENATLPEMADFFKHCGPIRINRRLNQPAINIYTDKDSGKPKGDATLSYEEPAIAKAAVEYFDGKEFQGRRLKVSMARRKPMMGGMRGGMPMRGGPGMDRGGMGRGGDRGGFPSRGGPRGGMGWNGPPGGNVQKRAGDWECPNPGCGNQNFSWRMECNQCKAPKPEGLGAPPFPTAGDRGGFRGGRGGMDRGGFRGGSRGGPPMDRGGRRGMGPPGKMDMRDHRQERRDRPY
ncbi:EWS RNA-binding protein 1b isoform X4 [Ctenopharyngodon idella]|uniref:EWS RNA-binding protein 1b isoform X4 n=1 Tax=Ctenopharyngodon idella TaxID=7959 RepID=UPI002230B204|nr:EWS RNA-binding protein 1b isoform X4 [Ctenopharyngodon idella]